jgi:hypothetical protein
LESKFKCAKFLGRDHYGKYFFVRTRSWVKWLCFHNCLGFISSTVFNYNKILLFLHQLNFVLKRLLEYNLQNFELNRNKFLQIQSSCGKYYFKSYKKIWSNLIAIVFRRLAKDISSLTLSISQLIKLTSFCSKKIYLNDAIRDQNVILSFYYYFRDLFLFVHVLIAAVQG